MADQAAAGPSTANIALGTAIISLVCGYFLGQGQSIGLFGVGSSSGGPSLTRGSGHMSRDDELSGEDDDDQQQLSSDEDDYDVGELSTEFADPTEECKLVLVVRSDLGMGKGKVAGFSYSDSSPSSPCHIPQFFLVCLFYTTRTTLPVLYLSFALYGLVSSCNGRNFVRRIVITPPAH